MKRWTLHFAANAPAAVRLPGLLESRRDGRELQVTIADVDGSAEQAVAALGAESMEQSPLTLEDGVVAYLGRRGEKVSLLASTRERAGV